MSGRPNPSLTQTNWALIRDASSASPTARTSLETVARRCWPAVYAFIRASGRSATEATDLTQGFLCDVFLSRKLLEKADAERGRFRTLLMGAVRNYLADAHRRRTASSRMPKDGLVGLDAIRERGGEPPDAGTTSPERAFHARYVGGLIRAATERLQRELLEAGDEASWEIFRLRVLQPAFEGVATGYDEIAPRFGLERGTCAARLLVAKRRFAAILMEELRGTVAQPEDLDAEVAELLALLTKRS